MAPTKYTLLVKWNGNTVVHPSSFASVWADHGSGGDHDVEVYRMNAPDGYSCLGGVAMETYNEVPDAEHYCCIKNNYLVNGQWQKLYDSSGTGVSAPLSLWETLPGPDPSGIEVGIFVPSEIKDGSVYTYPPGDPYMLNNGHEDVKEVWNVTNPPKMPLDVYEVPTQLEVVWDNSGLGNTRHQHLRILRATSDPENGYYSVSDVAVPNWLSSQMAFLIKTTDKHSDAFAVPLAYNKIWSCNKGDKYIQVWRPSCPADYVYLGFVATTTPDTPEPGKIYCIRSDYVTYGAKKDNFKRIYQGNECRWVQFFQSRSSKEDQQGLCAMYARQSENLLPINPYFLKVGTFNYIAEKPVIKVEIYGVEYDMDNEEKVVNPESLVVTYVINESSKEQVCTRKIEFQTTKTTSFTFSNSVSWGITTSVEADIPLFAKETTTIGSSAEIGFDSGEEYSESYLDSISAQILVPSMKKTMATISGRKYRSDIPYTATVKKTYFDGDTSISKVAGLFRGVEVSEVTVTYGDTYDLNEGEINSKKNKSSEETLHNEL